MTKAATAAEQHPLPEKKDRHHQFDAVVEMAGKEGASVRYFSDDKTERLVVDGGGAKKIQRALPKIARDATVVKDDVDAFTCVWEKSALVRRSPEKTKPDGSLPDKDVLNAVPHLVETARDLDTVCVKLADMIEKAYPNVRLSSKGFGSGKWKLVADVADKVMQVTGRHIDRAGAIIMLRLGRHMGTESGQLGKLEVPPPARAFTR